MSFPRGSITAALGACAYLTLASGASAATNNVFTVAGGGGSVFSGDGGLAAAAGLNVPVAVGATADGGFAIADPEDQRVRRVRPDGTIITIAGTGTAGFSGDGGPATAAAVNTPESVVELAGGGLLIADFGNHRVRLVAPDGTISTVAGTGQPGSAGDGGPATAAQLDAPIGLAVTTSGGFLVADASALRVRRVAPDGTITTVAGTGEPGDAGDGGPATAAQLSAPTGVAA